MCWMLILWRAMTGLDQELASVPHWVVSGLHSISPAPHKLGTKHFSILASRDYNHIITLDLDPEWGGGAKLCYARHTRRLIQIQIVNCHYADGINCTQCCQFSSHHNPGCIPHSKQQPRTELQTHIVKRLLLLEESSSDIILCEDIRTSKWSHCKCLTDYQCTV